MQRLGESILNVIVLATVMVVMACQSSQTTPYIPSGQPLQPSAGPQQSHVGTEIVKVGDNQLSCDQLALEINDLAGQASSAAKKMLVVEDQVSLLYCLAWALAPRVLHPPFSEPARALHLPFSGRFQS
jgi:hypothetical protein